MSQCGEAVNNKKVKNPLDNKQKQKKNTISDTINTIATGSELITIDKDKEKGGFFSENANAIAKSSKSIEKAIEKISSELNIVNLNGQESRLMHERIQGFIS